jgi:signal transduction histidine kinase
VKRRPTRLLWALYAAGSGLVLLALAASTRVALQLEQAELRARWEAHREQNLRLALWRLDSWMAPLLATEATRPYFAYLPYIATSRPWSNLLQAPRSREPLRPSPLHHYRSPFIELHFQVDPDGHYSSPYLPPPGWGDDEAEPSTQEAADRAAIRDRLRTLRAKLPSTLLYVRVERGADSSVLSKGIVDGLAGTARAAETDLLATYLAQAGAANGSGGGGAERFTAASPAPPPAHGDVDAGPGAGGGDRERAMQRGDLGAKQGSAHRAQSNAREGVPGERSAIEWLRRKAVYQTAVRAAEEAQAPTFQEQRLASAKRSRQASTLDTFAGAEMGLESIAEAAEEDAVRDSPSTPTLAAKKPAAAPKTGPLVPFWLPAPDAPGAKLLFARRVVDATGRRYYQGFVCAWPRLRQALEAQIEDLLPEAAIIPAQPLQDAAVRLATLPAAVQLPPLRLPPLPLWTATRATLLLAWLVVLSGVAAVATSLRASIHFGDRRSRFAAAVTHELRTPLTTFQLYTEMLADGMVPPGPPQQGYLRTLKEESRRLARLVENVLAYARVEEGRHIPQSSIMPISALLERLFPALQRRAAEENLELRNHPLQGPDRRIRIDLDACEQILGNLVDNACKYAPDSGTLELRPRCETEWLLLAIQDHGSGIDADQARRIFHPFERGDNANPDLPGLGLGLALARSLARDMGGDLLLERGSGRGACFILKLPLQPRSSSAQGAWASIANSS